MKRIEDLPEEQREVAEALQRAATPTHEPSEQITEEFDSRAVIEGLRLAIPDNIELGTE